MVNVYSLVCDLKAGGSHPEVHCVHVNLTRMRLIIILNGHVSMLVLIKRNLDVDFLASALVNRLSKA